MATTKRILYYKEVFSETHENRKHYQLIESNAPTKLLSAKITIVVCKLKKKTSARYKLKGNGLYKCNISAQHFTGSLRSGTHFLICEFLDNEKRLKVIIYPYFKPYDGNTHPSLIGARTTKEL